MSYLRLEITYLPQIWQEMFGLFKHLRVLISKETAQNYIEQHKWNTTALEFVNNELPSNMDVTTVKSYENKISLFLHKISLCRLYI